jgi:hypothetical protein
MPTRKAPLVLLAASLSLHAFAEEGLSTGDAARMLRQVQVACSPYSDNGMYFWRGELKRAEDAHGLVLLNKEIRTSVRKARSVEAAREIAWQKCLDFVFNNQNSKGFLK